jgi:hypothetical protein
MSHLKAKIWVDALIRRAELGLASIYVIRRGDEDAGAVLVKVVKTRANADLYVPARDASGDRIWSRFRNQSLPESDIDSYCRTRMEQDPDLWIIEIEDREGRNFLTEPVEIC